MTPDPIDIVVPWVDGGDPFWQAERAQAAPEQDGDSGVARYREWGFFRYWFRSISRYASWVRRVHLITWGHLPPWLNTDHPALHIVNHRDYIPAEYLPTFNSHTIELNLHRIPGLARQFVYFNDDVYLTAPTHPADFFRQSLPVDAAVLGRVSIADRHSYMPYLYLNMLGCINEIFSKSRAIYRHPGRWLNLRYGKGLLRNVYLLPGRGIPGFQNFHSCLPYTVDTLQQVWAAFPEELDRTCRHRFRSREDVNQYLFRYWRLMRGEFMPGKPKACWLTIGEDAPETIRRALHSRRWRVVCLNDDPVSGAVWEQRQQLAEILEEKFPCPCSFER